MWMIIFHTPQAEIQGDGIGEIALCLEVRGVLHFG
jgi:hypothetical protein